VSVQLYLRLFWPRRKETTAPLECEVGSVGLDVLEMRDVLDANPLSPRTSKFSIPTGLSRIVITGISTAFPIRYSLIYFKVYYLTSLSMDKFRYRGRWMKEWAWSSGAMILTRGKCDYCHIVRLRNTNYMRNRTSNLESDCNPLRHGRVPIFPSFDFIDSLFTYLLTYLLHGTESFLRS